MLEDSCGMGAYFLRQIEMTSQQLVTTITLATSHVTLCVQKKQIKISNFEQSVILFSLIDLQLNSQRFPLIRYIFDM